MLGHVRKNTEGKRWEITAGMAAVSDLDQGWGSEDTEVDRSKIYLGDN